MPLKAFEGQIKAFCVPISPRGPILTLIVPYMPNIRSSASSLYASICSPLDDQITLRNKYEKLAGDIKALKVPPQGPKLVVEKIPYYTSNNEKTH